MSALYSICGQSINVSSVAHAVDEIIKRVSVERAFYICTLNLDHLVKLKKDRVFAETYSRAKLVTADGFPIVLLAKLDGVKIRRAAGSDLVQPLCVAASKIGAPIYFVGPSNEAISGSISKLREMCSEIQVAGTSVPSLDFNPRGLEAARIAREISISNAKICFVALGAPKQEIFSAFAAEQIRSKVAFIPVGAALEFLAGLKSRAPVWAQELGLEWFWRVASEPRRLAIRYLECWLLLVRLLVERFVSKNRAA